MKIAFEVTATELWAANLFASEDESRFVLNSVSVELRHEQGLTRALLIATDGRRLAALRSEKGLGTEAHEPVQFLIRSDLIARCVEETVVDPIRAGPTYYEEDEETAAPAPQTVHGTYDSGEKTIRLERGGITYEAPPIEGVYPNWRNVIPKRDEPAAPAAGLALNFALLHDFHRALEALTGRLNYRLRCNGNGDAGPVEIGEPGGAFYGVLMKMKMDTEDACLPSAPKWIDAPAPNQQSSINNPQSAIPA